jgi:hypothetical protein
MSSHAEHLRRHIDRIADGFGDDKRRELIERCGLDFDGNLLRANTGEDVAEAHCREYLAILDESFGEGYTKLVRFNFELAGCRGSRSA